MRRIAIAGLAVALVACTSTPRATTSTTPSPAASIDTQFGVDIWSMSADGSAQHDVRQFKGQDLFPSYSPDGARIAFASNRPGDFDLYVMDATGTAEPARITQSTGNDRDPSWSPDGARLVFTSDRDGQTNRDLYVIGADGKNEKRLTNTTGDEITPAWSPDGKLVAFAAGSGAVFEIDVMNADGTGVRALTTTKHNSIGPAWSPDGTQLVYYDLTANDIFRVNVADGAPVKITTDAGEDLLPAWAPSANIAYTHGTKGNHDIWVMDPDGKDAHALTTGANDEFSPTWAPDGRIAYSRNVTL